MDPTQFDALTRTLSDLTDRLPSRRGLLRGLAAGLFGVATHAGLADDGAADKRGKGKGRGKGRKRSCPTGQVRCNRHCVGCCTDADCGGNVCAGGTCSRCPAGQQLCRGGCIPETACCADSDCTGNRVCTSGTCECAPSDRLCEGVCINRRDCCGTDCPPTPQPPQPPPPPPPTCTPENCNGCCDGTTCKDGDSQNFCGRGGVTCVACQPKESCDAGSCVCTTECCGDEDCVAGIGGLCRPNGTCVYRPECLGAGEGLPNGCAGNIEFCCSQACDPIDISTGTCAQSLPGDPCLTDTDCLLTPECRFYVCASA